MKREIQIFLINLLFLTGIQGSDLSAQDISQVIRQKYEEFKSASIKERVLVVNDRDIYAPGDFIWFTGVVYDVHSPVISTGSSKMKLRLLDMYFSEILFKEVNVNEGIARGFLVLPQNLRNGVYYLSGSTEASGNASYYRQKIIIQDKVVPPFIIDVSFPDQFFKPGQQVPVTINIKDYYSESLKNLSLQVDLFDGKNKVETVSLKLKKNNLQHHFQIPKQLNSGLFMYQIIAQSRASTATIRGIIPVRSEITYLEFFPENGILVDGLETKIGCFVYDAAGIPIETDVEIMNGNEVIARFHTDDDGLGSFGLKPQSGMEYYAKFSVGAGIDKIFPLPKVRKHGYALNAHKLENGAWELSVRSTSSSTARIYLAGVAGGNLFMVTSQTISEEAKVDLDFTNINSPIAYLILMNESLEIEGELVVWIGAKPLSEPAVQIKSANHIPRSKEIVEVTAAEPGIFVFRAVNGSWMANNFLNQNLSLISMPPDLIESQALFQKSNGVQSINLATLSKFIPYYEPQIFGWDKVLEKNGTLRRRSVPVKVLDNLCVYQEVAALCMVSRTEDLIIHSNLASKSIMPAANPGYLTKLYSKKEPRKPAYKTMLENGTPILEVIRSIKPFNLSNNKIVFFGSNNSLLYQDGALFIIDGIQRGTDASILSNLNPFDIDKINISTNPIDIQRYTGLNSVGIIEIDLKKGDGMTESTALAGDDEQEFESPDYEKGYNSTVDMRSTLYWKTVSSDKEVIFTYFNADFISNVKGNVYFFPNSNPPATRTFEYDVK